MAGIWPWFDNLANVPHNHSHAAFSHTPALTSPHLAPHSPNPTTPPHRYPHPQHRQPTRPTLRTPPPVLILSLAPSNTNTMVSLAYLVMASAAVAVATGRDVPFRAM